MAHFGKLTRGLLRYYEVVWSKFVEKGRQTFRWHLQQQQQQQQQRQQQQQHQQQQQEQEQKLEKYKKTITPSTPLVSFGFKTLLQSTCRWSRNPPPE